MRIFKLPPILYLTSAFGLIFLANWVHGENYYLNAYEKQGKGEAHAIYVKCVDLTSRTITDSIKLSEGGFPQRPKPMFFFHDGKRLMIVFVQYGFSPRSMLGEKEKLIYFILDESLDLIKKVELPGASYMGGLYDSNDSTIMISMYRDGRILTPVAPEYRLDENFDFQRAEGSGVRSSDIFEIHKFEYVQAVGQGNPHGICTGYIPPRQWWMLRLDSLRTAVIDSFLINTDSLATTVYAYFPPKDKLYLFRLNYDNHSPPLVSEKRSGENWIKPVVDIYDPASFRILETLPLPDCLPYNCPGESGGPCEIIGDLIVYYFFYGEDSGAEFHAAMLFIFDTRTNDASWLPVGWR